MSHLLDTLANWKPFNAIVVGDFMLDQLVFGNADRLSPEAPVPVLNVQRSEDRPGGAANVCLDLAAMRAKVFAIGVTGEDREADLLRAALASSGINADALVADPDRPTTLKQSLIGLAQHRHPQKMFRLDKESRLPLTGAIESAIIARFEALLPGAQVVCIEDYNKGVCTPRVCRAIIDRARALGVPVLVDPAAIEDYSKYRGATTITPNRSEAALASAIEIADSAEPHEHATVARTLLESLDLEAMVITLDRQGALLLERDGAPLVVPTYARQVYDVTGAGDMVLAALAAARANGIDWPGAVRFANAAAGLEVEVFGVVPMPIERIHREVMLREGIAGVGGAAQGKLRTRAQLLVEVAALRKEGKHVVLTNGCFDILHSGHVHLLREAKSAGDYLIVAINTDRSVREGKGPNRPINSESQRAELLGALECVDAVVIFDEQTPAALIEQVRPAALVKGDEYPIDQIPGAAFVLRTGGKVIRIPMRPGMSTTSTLERMGDARAEIVTSADARAEWVNDTTR